MPVNPSPANPRSESRRSSPRSRYPRRAPFERYSGQSSAIAEAGFGRHLDLTVLPILRDKTQSLPARAETELREGDAILVQGGTGEILKIKDVTGIDIKADAGKVGVRCGEGSNLISQRSGVIAALGDDVG